MSHYARVSGFEFRRHLDIRGELVGLLLLAVIALVKLGGDAILAKEAATTIQISAGGTPVAGMNEGRFQFANTKGDTATNGQPTLSMESGDYVLRIAQAPGWIAELQHSLDSLHRQHSLQALGVSADQLRHAESPASLRVVDLFGVPALPNSSLTAISISMVVLTTLAILGCLGMLFQGLLSERFAHVTEMILSASPPGFWLDCKVAASICHGMKTITIYGVYAAFAWMLMSESTSMFADISGRSWGLVVGLLAFCFLGLMLWNWFFAACATAIRSPHSAFRNTLAAFPLTMIMIGFGGLKAPEGLFMQAMSLFPFTSMAAMPIRLLYVDVPKWQLLVSVVLLAASAAILRTWARRNFRDAIVSPIDGSASALH
ncbi:MULTISPECIES: ABC transporter permease [unclassified Stenotrophomonas maltophilia group]|uniref:ABC transporter permease n=1 Tax=unclassified Stenotrophomonas maltophilia group TaxID=2961925 RepID=UPI0020B122E1|nr:MULTISPECIES: ABC transporter permease [unclassified Stenotrophomonas maltophilia group]